MTFSVMNELEHQITAATDGVPEDDHILALVSRADGIESGHVECQSGDWSDAEREQVAALLRRDIETLRQIQREEAR